mmetsp:Transcript_27918/g.80041  ORF Transcript_27918/g.80041 Transcript_27918/m.80041 type:complete len:233 (-) Transcript_27918:1164-1862(-)
MPLAWDGRPARQSLLMAIGAPICADAVIRCRISRFWILPVAPRGRSPSHRMICAGTLNDAKRSRAWRRNSSSDGALASALNATATATASPSVSCGTPIAATSATAGCSKRAPSTSAQEMFSPPRMMMSLARSMMYTKPSSSTVPMSPLRNQSLPSLSMWKTSLVLSGFRQYSRINVAPRMQISPMPPRGARLPSSSRMQTSTLGTGKPQEVARKGNISGGITTLIALVSVRP